MTPPTVSVTVTSAFVSPARSSVYAAVPDAEPCAVNAAVWSQVAVAVLVPE